MTDLPTAVSVMATQDRLHAVLRMIAGGATEGERNAAANVLGNMIRNGQVNVEHVSIDPVWRRVRLTEFLDRARVAERRAERAEATLTELRSVLRRHAKEPAGR